MYLRTTGSGDDIFVNSADNIALKVHGSNDGINITGGGSVQLYHNNSEKLATTSGGVNVTGALTVNGSALNTGPLVAYKAKEMLYSRYSFTSGSWTELKSDFRISHTPAAVGNTIICAVQIYLVISENTYGGLTIVSNQGSGSDEAMLGETNTSSGVAKGSILGGNYANEQMRQSGGTTWLGQHLWGYHITENTNAHTFKLFGRMGSGTRYIGDNQMGQLMQIWEYSGNLMQ
mgnify:CR=1 FL=1